MSANIDSRMTNWKGLPDIDHVQELSHEDRECLQEAMEVIRRNGLENRFGVTLLHSHFDLADDEFMLESCDLERRTLTIRPAKHDTVPTTDYRPTSWRWDQGSIRPVGACASGEYGSHYGYKDD